MIFMRTVEVRLCQVKTYHTDFAVTSLGMPVNGFMTHKYAQTQN